MTCYSRLRSRLVTTLALVFAFAPTGAVRANEVGSSVHSPGFVIHDASETLRNYCRWNGTTLVFTVPGGTSWDLVTSTSDPAITNPGDGSFHAFDAFEVRAALAGVHFPLQRVSAEIFILPYPRRAGFESAAGPGLILLSPGVRTLPVAQQHADLTHELGHVVQYTLMPDADAAAWARYRQLRGITDAITYSASAPHVSRPHEIFAEDFRALFGDEQANAAGTIENADLAYPNAVAGLEAFMLSLAGAPVIETPLTLATGARGSARFARSGASTTMLDLFDVSGRRVASLSPAASGNGCVWSWDGRGATGAPVGATVLFARARDGVGGVARLVRLR